MGGICISISESREQINDILGLNVHFIRKLNNHLCVT